MNKKNNIHFNNYLYNANILRNISYYFLILHKYIVTTIPHVTRNCALMRTLNLKSRINYIKKEENK